MSLQNSMTRSELVAALELHFVQLSHDDAEAVVKTMLDAMGHTLEQGGRIEIRGFGSFSVHERSPRMGRNPRTGEAVAVPAKCVPHFKAGKALREAVDASTTSPSDSSMVSVAL